MDLEFEIFTPETEADFAELWKFNYQIFASELKMRQENPDGFIVDKFHHKNIYLAARNKVDNAIIGMIAAHWQAPYSAEAHFGSSVAIPPSDGGKLGDLGLVSRLQLGDLGIRLGRAFRQSIGQLGDKSVDLRLRVVIFPVRAGRQREQADKQKNGR